MDPPRSPVSSTGPVSELTALNEWCKNWTVRQEWLPDFPHADLAQSPLRTLTENRLENDQPAI